MSSKIEAMDAKMVTKEHFEAEMKNFVTKAHFDTAMKKSDDSVHNRFMEFHGHLNSLKKELMAYISEDKKK